jgi:serine/threonine protein kinase
MSKTPPNPPLPAHLRLEGTGEEIFDLGDQYTALHVVGKGAFGCVVAAECKISGKRVAIKKVKTALSDRAAALRLLREVRFLQQLRGHPNVINLLDILLSETPNQVLPAPHALVAPARDGPALRSWTCTS